MQADLKGINEAKNYWQAYFDKYTFEHEVLAGAVDKEASAAFCFWLDRVRQVRHCFDGYMLGELHPIVQQHCMQDILS